MFTSDDLNSKHVTSALDQRNIPFVEVSLARYPSVRKQLKALAFNYSVPQVFFNTRHVGGVVKTLEELRKWDADAKYATPLDKYEAQIASAGDPRNIMMAVPAEGTPVEVEEETVVIRKVPLSIELPDGTMTTVIDITEKLKNTLLRNENRYQNILYKNSFPGASAAQTFRKSMELSDEAAIKFGQRLLDAKIINHVGGSKEFKDSAKAVYRLQCFMTPDILNSYRVWNEPSDSDVFGLVARLDVLLASIEDSAIDKNGKVNMSVAAVNELYPIFEESVCELQAVNISGLKEKEMLAFGINLFKLMVRYAFIKIGVPLSEADRLHLLNNVKFNLGGNLFTFQEWVDGVLRGNRKATYCNRIPFNSVDRRRKFALSDLDHRIHFALNLDSRLGSTSSVPFSRYSAENIDEELDVAARVFCADENKVSLKKSDEIMISQTFGWYRSDFSKKDIGLLHLIASYLEHTKKSQLERGLDSIRSIKFGPIVWSRNASDFTRYDKARIVSDVKGIEKILRRFVPPKTPANEELRLATLHSLNLLDTLPEERFDRITKMVKDDFDVPLVFISLVDMNRQWFKSRQWDCPVPEASETGRDVSFCGHAINLGDTDILVVENALEDDRFADNPLVTGDLSIRFYAGCTLTVPSIDGVNKVNIGSLCIIDQKPRKMSESDLAKLREYAGKVKKEILRRDSEAGYMSTGSD